MDTNSIQHIYHHNDRTPLVNVSAERNSKGYNWSVTVTGANDPAQAESLAAVAETTLRERFGQGLALLNANCLLDFDHDADGWTLIVDNGEANPPTFRLTDRQVERLIESYHTYAQMAMETR